MMLAYSHSDDLEVMISELMKCSLLDIFKANHISNTQIPKRTQVIYAQVSHIGEDCYSCRCL
jgi:hypothetical protein